MLQFKLHETLCQQILVEPQLVFMKVCACFSFRLVQCKRVGPTNGKFPGSIPDPSKLVNIY